MKIRILIAAILPANPLIYGKNLALIPGVENLPLSGKNSSLPSPPNRAAKS
jgi:hypothetical protein